MYTFLLLYGFINMTIGWNLVIDGSTGMGLTLVGCACSMYLMYLES